MAELQYPALPYLDLQIGNISGASYGNKWGYNADIDIASGEEVIASFGGTYVAPTTAYTLNVVSSSAEDGSGGTGALTILIYGIDSNNKEVTELVTLNGITPVVTTNEYFGVNRVVVYTSGSTLANVGDITLTHSTGGAVQAVVPATAGVTQQVIYHTPQGYRGIVHTVEMNVVKTGSGQSPLVTIKAYQYSRVTGTRYEVYRHYFDSAKQSHGDDTDNAMFVMDGRTTTWFVASTDKDDTQVSLRVGYTLIQA